MVIIGIGNLLLLMVIFTFILMHLRDLGDKTQLSLNGISHVWGMLAELKEEEEWNIKIQWKKWIALNVKSVLENLFIIWTIKFSGILTVQKKQTICGEIEDELLLL